MELISLTYSCGTLRSAVKNDREARKSLCDLFKDIKTKRRRNENAVSVPCALLRLELISAVGSTDSDSERVNAGLGNELLDLFRTGVRRISRGNLDVILNAGKSSELTLNDDAMRVSVLNNLALVTAMLSSKE